MVFFLPMTLFSLASSNRDLAVFGHEMIPINMDEILRIARNKKSQECEADRMKCPDLYEECAHTEKCNKPDLECIGPDINGKKKCFQTVSLRSNSPGLEASRAELRLKKAEARKKIAEKALQDKVNSWEEKDKAGEWKIHKNRSCEKLKYFVDEHFWDKSIDECKEMCIKFKLCTTIVIGNYGTPAYNSNYCGLRSRTKIELTSPPMCKEDEDFTTIQSPKAN